MTAGASRGAWTSLRPYGSEMNDEPENVSGVYCPIRFTAIMNVLFWMTLLMNNYSLNGYGWKSG